MQSRAREVAADAAADAASGARRAQHAAATADWRSPLARFGLVAKGVLYVALGVLAIRFAMLGGGDASKEGAIELVASQPFGTVLLVGFTAGLFALGGWQLLIMLTGDPVEGEDGEHRVKFGIKAVVYLGTAITALNVLLGDGGSSGGKQEATAMVMGWPGGRWLVGLAGLALFAFSLVQLWSQAYGEGFMERLDRARMHDGVEKGVESVGRAGYAARGIVLAIVGVFFVVAAWQHDSSEAVGLSGALHAIAERPLGVFVLWGVAVGLALYGVYCGAEARYRRAT
jgi:hypothetical protein